MSKPYQIRNVKPADLAQLFHLLNELVKHEGTADRFKMTPTRLESELFGKNADWYCLVANNKEDQIIGFCLYTFANINRAFNTSPMIQIDDLYVCPAYRQMGIGKAFFY